jgi:hypothetical protein
MVEYDAINRSSNRQVISSLIGGTLFATLYGPVPPQYSLEIMQEVFANPGSLAVSMQLLQFATLQGFTPQGTLVGTIVEGVTVPGGNTTSIGNGEDAVTKVEPGNLLLGLVNAPTTGSLVVKLFVRLVPGRGI